MTAVMTAVMTVATVPVRQGLAANSGCATIRDSLQPAFVICHHSSQVGREYKYGFTNQVINHGTAVLP